MHQGSIAGIGDLLRKIYALLFSVSSTIWRAPTICSANTASGKAIKAPLVSSEYASPRAAPPSGKKNWVAPMPVIRVAIAAPVTEGTFAALTQWSEQAIASRYDLVNHLEYQAYAERLRIRFPLSSRAAWRIAHVAHATHVLIIKPSKIAPEESARFLLIDARSGELLRSFAHLLPSADWGEKDKTDFATKLWMQLKRPLIPISSAISPASKTSRKAEDSAQSPHVSTSNGASERISLNTPSTLPVARNDTLQELQPRGKEASVATEHAAPQHEEGVGSMLQLSVGLSVDRRRATLHPRLLEAGRPPCFCKERGYSGAFPSLVVSGSLRPSAQQGHLGLSVATELGFSAQPSAAIHTGDSAGGIAFRLEPLLFYELSLHSACMLRPELGYFYRLFNITDGPFLALSRGGPQASLTTHLTSPKQRFQVDARTGVHMFLHEGAEAARLGHRKRGLGFFFELAPKIQFNIFFAQIGFRFEQASLLYSGATALFDDAALEDVHLTDTVFGGFAAAGLAL